MFRDTDPCSATDRRTDQKRSSTGTGTSVSDDTFCNTDSYTSRKASPMRPPTHNEINDDILRQQERFDFEGGSHLQEARRSFVAVHHPREAAVQVPGRSSV